MSPRTLAFFCCLGLFACGEADDASQIADTTGAGVDAAADTTAAPDTAEEVDTTPVADTAEAPDGADTSATPDSAAEPDAADAAGADADAEPGDTSPSCLVAYDVGERYPVGDDCNFCECLADGSSACTARACPSTTSSCTYDGVERPYAARFPATDGCNECVCAASGLACTRRCPELPEEGAILLESLDEACGENPDFTGAKVLADMPTADVTVPFAYNHEGPLYPETLADTDLRLRVVYDRGYVVCRIPSPTQPAIDMEVVVEWMTADGAFDEGFHTYLRRNDFGFLDAWIVNASAPVAGLDGSYQPNCLDPQGFGFSALIHADGAVTGDVFKVCEVDIALTVGAFDTSP